MKYIRTKYQIYDTYSKYIHLQETKYAKKTEYYYQTNDLSIPFELKVLKQADTIEELCDRFIVEYENGSFTIFTDFRDLKKHFDYYPQDYHKVTGRYGAILVKGKGLIYRAKMNDKGELELL